MGRPRTNAERDAEIIRRRKAGEWPTEIARELGLTRNTVIGALNRAGMCSADVDRSAIAKRFNPPPLRGDQHPAAKLTASEVAAIRREFKPRDPDFGGSALAARYGVHPCHLSAIVHGRRWVSQ
jgi:hypothetical protein